MKEFILASTSPYRKAILDSLGLPYRSASPAFEEINEDNLGPREMADAFARGKAWSLRDRFPHALILGSDQVPALGDTILRKPESPSEAVAELLALSGRTHELITSMALLDSSSGVFYEQTIVHKMEMRVLTPHQAQAYVIQDNPIGCAGGYRIEGSGTALFRKMEGMDHTGIIGLPVSVLGTLLEKAGASWLDRIFPETE